MLYFLVYNDNTHNYYLDKLLQSVKIYGEEFNIIIFEKMIYILILLKKINIY
jgi:hypothetical protein